MAEKIPLLRPYFDEEEMSEIRGVLESGWVSQGPKTRELERACAGYLGAKHAVALCNCTAALHLALLAIGVGKGDEVLVADYTFPATGHAVLYCGARPRFVDVDPRTYNMDPDKLKARLTPKTKAIVPVHTFGQPADMERILEFAGENGLRVIEDAACAFGAKRGRKFAGTLGDVGCYSFHARKGLTTGEGGLAVTDDAGLAERMRHLSVFGMRAAWDREGKKFSVPSFTDVGYNYKLSDISAAVGVVQLRRLDRVVERKRALAGRWTELLSGTEGIAPPWEDPGSTHVFQTYAALVDRGVDRNGLVDRLAEAGVQANIGTYSSHVQPVYGSKDRCPVSLDVFERSLALPLYYSMNEDQVDDAAARLRAVLEGRK
jgi:perosamine synthetase